MDKHIYLNGVIVKRKTVSEYEVFIPLLDKNKICKKSSRLRYSNLINGGDSVNIEFSIYDEELKKGLIVEVIK